MVLVMFRPIPNPKSVSMTVDMEPYGSVNQHSILFTKMSSGLDNNDAIASRIEGDGGDGIGLDEDVIFYLL